MSQDQDGQSSPADEDVNSGMVAALYASVSRILARYSQQWDTTKQMLGAEWELTLKSLWLALVFVIVLMSVVVVTWLGVNALLAYALYTIATPVWGIALAILALNMLVIFVLTRTIRGLFKSIGFGRSLAVFSPSETEQQDADEATMPAQSGGM